MDYRQFFSLQYISLVINECRMLLNTQTKIKLVKHSNEGDSYFTVREVDGLSGKRIGEFRCSTPKGKELYDKYMYYHSIENKLKEYTDLWFAKTSQPIPYIASEKILQYKTFEYSRLNTDFYQQLECQTGRLKYNRTRNAICDDIAMASKIEVIVAKIIEQLDLNYKYEAKIYINNYEKLADFFICIPLVNRCFPIEVLGFFDDINYLHKFERDIGNYIQSGYMFGKNLLLLGENSKNKVDTENIAREICDFINRIVATTIKACDNGFTRAEDINIYP